MENVCTLYEFSQLPNYQRFSLLEDCGTYLQADRIEGPIKIYLFQLFDFYVEVHFDHEGDRIVKADPFNNYSKLDKYVQHIDISDIYA